MRVLNLVRWTAGCVVALAAGLAGAASILVALPEFTGPAVPAGPFPQPAVDIGTLTFTIPPGEVVTDASVSGFWGAPPPGDPNSTAGVTVMLDGITVATCVKPDPSCWSGSVGQRPWSYTLTALQAQQLNDGVAKLTAVQTSETNINLGVTTLRIETGTPSPVPTMSPLGLLALFAAMSAAGSFALRRLARRKAARASSS